MPHPILVLIILGYIALTIAIARWAGAEHRAEIQRERRRRGG